MSSDMSAGQSWVCKSLESSTKELESCEISAILYGFFVEILNWVCGLVKMAARWLEQLITLAKLEKPVTVLS